MREAIRWLLGGGSRPLDAAAASAEAAPPAAEPVGPVTVVEPPPQHLPVPADAALSISQFSYFAGFVVLRGWVHRPGRTVQTMALQVGGIRCVVAAGLPSSGGPTPDCGFALDAHIGIDGPAFLDPALHVRFDDGAEAVFDKPGLTEILQDRGHQLFPEFVRWMHGRQASGRLLEIGSRARSGTTRRWATPPGWDYIGTDIVEGPNVDVVGDAHALSSFLPHDSFDAAMSLSVFEHLAMPWKVVLELNRVMKTGSLMYISTHQAFPLHDEPWDFWRVSADAWPVLFNAKTGFRVVEAAMAEPLMFVARRWHPGVHLNELRGCAVSAVLVEKTGPTSLTWDVNLADCLSDRYPV